MEKQRLDKIIASTGKFSRREIKLLVKQGRVLINGKLASSPEEKYDPEEVSICVDGEALTYRRYTWIMLHKPAGELSATEDGRGKRSWICCRRSSSGRIFSRWDGWIRIRRACCF